MWNTWTPQRSTPGRCSTPDRLVYTLRNQKSPTRRHSWNAQARKSSVVVTLLACCKHRPAHPPGLTRSTDLGPGNVRVGSIGCILTTKAWAIEGEEQVTTTVDRSACPSPFVRLIVTRSVRDRMGDRHEPLAAER